MTVDGGEGFANSATGLQIRSDIITELADSLAHVINTQVLPWYLIKRWGVERYLKQPTIMYWETSTAKDQNSRAAALQQAATAALQLLEVSLKARELSLSAPNVNVTEIFQEFGVPVQGDADGDGVADQGEIIDTEGVEVVEDKDSSKSINAPSNSETSSS